LHGLQLAGLKSGCHIGVEIASSELTAAHLRASIAAEASELIVKLAVLLRSGEITKASGSKLREITMNKSILIAARAIAIIISKFKMIHIHFIFTILIAHYGSPHLLIQRII